MIEARTCSHEGCNGAPSVRGMCRKHYRSWLVSVPQLNMNSRTRTLMLAALPGTQKALIEKSQLAPQTVKRAIAKLRDNGEMHVGRFTAPTAKGEQWHPVFVRGPGVDAVVSDRAKHNQHKRNVRAAYRRRFEAEKAKKIRSATVRAFTWAATLMMDL